MARGERKRVRANGKTMFPRITKFGRVGGALGSPTGHVRRPLLHLKYTPMRADFSAESARFLSEVFRFRAPVRSSSLKDLSP